MSTNVKDIEEHFKQALQGPIKRLFYITLFFIQSDRLDIMIFEY